MYVLLLFGLFGLLLLLQSQCRGYCASPRYSLTTIANTSDQLGTSISWSTRLRQQDGANKKRDSLGPLHNVLQRKGLAHQCVKALGCLLVRIEDNHMYSVYCEQGDSHKHSSCISSTIKSVHPSMRLMVGFVAVK
jgi:hypothetical protein